MRISLIALGVLYGGAIVPGGVRYRYSPWLEAGHPALTFKSHPEKNATAVW